MLHSLPKILAVLLPGLFFLCMASQVQAKFTLRIASIESADFQLAELAIRPRLAASSLGLDIDVAQISTPKFALPLRNTKIRCDQIVLWQCSGTLRSRLGKQVINSLISAAMVSDQFNIVFASGKGQRRAEINMDARNEPIVVQLFEMPWQWLQIPLDTLVDGFSLGDGSVSGQLSFQTQAGSAINAELQLRGIGLDSSDGEVAAAAMDIDATLVWQTDSATAQKLSVVAKLKSGEWLLSPLYTQVPDHGVEFKADAQSTDGLRWNLDAWQWNDPGALVANGSAQLDAEGDIVSLQINNAQLVLQSTLPRYGESILAAFGYAGMQASGNLSVQGSWSPRDSYRLQINGEGLQLIDKVHGVQLNQLNVSAYLRDAQNRESKISWGESAAYGVPLGESQVQFTSTVEQFKFSQPLRVPLLGGSLQLPHLSYLRSGELEERLDTALTIENVSVKDLSKAMGWPEFGGRISATIPQVTWQNQRLDFNGEVNANVFDGQLKLTNLSLERPLGVAPSMSADIVFDDLDLQLLTGAFSFGQIEGKLDGEISQLRLVDWSPSKFQAKFKTDSNYKGRQRISQNAVNGLSSVGGAGVGVPSGLLGIFDSFGYADIGLSCALENNVCIMDGLDSSGSGYTILRGAGLPRLTVVGHQRRVHWPVLVQRLKKATEGVAPVIQ